MGRAATLKRELQYRLIASIGERLGVGPALGKIKYVATSGGYYEDNLLEIGIKSDSIFTSVTEAEDATTASRHDVVAVTPGYYDEEDAITWDKAQTHLVGLSSGNVFGDFSESNVVIYTDSTDVGSVITGSGANCQFHNVLVQNYGNNAACLTAFTLDGYGWTFKNVGFQGTMTAGNDDVVAAASLYIDDGGSYPVFEDCVIGQNAWDVREGALSGVLRYVGTGLGGPYNGTFRNCRFLSRSETATVAMVALPANYCMHGIWLFNGCSFENYSESWAANLNQVFYDNCGTTHGILLKDCVAIGIDEWQDADAGNNYIASTMPIVGLGGGLARNPTAVTGS
jgi:hypothetical protein